MKRHWWGLAGVLAFLTAAATAQPIVINGEADDILYNNPYGNPTQYPYPLAIQDTQTGFGDSDLGRPDWANGSELDAAYATIYGDTLYLVLAGNLETNGNKMEIFFDTRPGGQNQLLGVENPDVDFGALQRMGYLDAENPGLKFESNFTADFYVTITAIGDPTAVYVSYAELYVDEFNPGVGYYCGEGRTRCETVGGQLFGGDLDAPAILCTIDNSNTAGVDGGFGIGDGSGVVTGIELAIPLSALGNPAGDIKVCAFINGVQHDFMSNQVLEGVAGFVSENFGEPRKVDFSAFEYFGTQYFVVPRTYTPIGACCIGDSCSIKTQQQCTTQGGTYLGDNINCAGNPCDAVPSGACCVFGVCSVATETECVNVLGGEYQGDETNCDYCPCSQPGACCIEETCQIMLESDCLALTGEFLGEYSNCGDTPEDNPCLRGACCIGDECFLYRQEQCQALNGLYLGDGTTCEGNPCASGACCIDNLCFVIREDDCTVLEGAYLGPGSTCAGNPCGTPAGLLNLDGGKDGQYHLPLSVQDTQTGFGDNTDPAIDTANGSELNAAYAWIVHDRLHLLLTGNLESNWNKLEIFFDSRPGGQNTLNNSPLPGGPVAIMDGLTFDDGFEADFWITVMIGTAGSVDFKLDYAELYVDENNPGVALYLGSGRAADLTQGGFLYPDIGNPGWGNPYNILATINNSNLAGVVGGSGLIGPDEHPEAVTTGVELSIPLAAIGNPTQDIKICAFVNGQNHDWLSNQVLGPLGGSENLGYPPSAVNFANLPGDQWFLVPINSCGEQVRGNANCDPNQEVDGFDIAPFVLALSQPDVWSQTYPDCNLYCVCDMNCDGSIDGFDIQAFVAALTGQGACCLPGGACELRPDESSCLNDGGVYLGNGTNCWCETCP